MKQLFTALFFIIFAYSAQAQDNGRIDAGMYLARSGANFKASYLTAGAAAVCVALTPLNPDYRKPLYGIGAVFGVVSIITGWSAYTNLEKAGQALQASPTSGLTVTPNGFAYKF